MEIWEIIGIEMNASFKGDSGQLVPGIRLHLIADAEPGAGIDGKRCRNQFISNQAVQKHGIVVKPGNIIKFEFNRFGNICRVEVT